jgi:hypothetical protein
MQSSLRALFGDRVRIAAASRVSSGSPVHYLLRAEPGFDRTVSAARTLAKRHVRLQVAKAAVERLTENEDVAIEVPKVEDPKSFESELEQLGIKAIRREAMAMAKQPDLARSD